MKKARFISLDFFIFLPFICLDNFKLLFCIQIIMPFDAQWRILEKIADSFVQYSKARIIIHKTE